MRKFIKSLLFYGHRDVLFKFTDMFALFCAYVTVLWVRWKFDMEIWTKLDTNVSMVQILKHIFFWTGFSENIGRDIRLEYADNALFYIIPMMLIMYALYEYLGFYRRRRYLRRQLMFPRVVLANGVLFSVLVATFFLIPGEAHPRSILLMFCTFNIAFCMVFRKTYGFFLTKVRRSHPSLQVPTLLLGDTEEAHWIEDIIGARHNGGLRIARRMTPRRDARGDFTLDALQDIERAIVADKVELVVLADKELPVHSVMRVLMMTGKRNIATKVLAESLAVLQIKVGEELEVVRGIPLVHFDGGWRTGKERWFRIILSRVLAALALLALSPALLLIAGLVWAADRGPVFFVQQRYGIHKKPFAIYKFRTMRVGAEAMQKDLEAQNESKGGGLFKIHDDPRVTRIGKILRKYSLDELPQIFNVLKGDMRVVGPRPLPKRDIDHYTEEWHFYRHDVYPGLTCLWQISGRSEIDFDTMCVLDVYYLQNTDWTMDLRIVLRTVAVMIIGRGAY